MGANGKVKGVNTWEFGEKGCNELRTKDPEMGTVERVNPEECFTNQTESFAVGIMGNEGKNSDKKILVKNKQSRIHENYKKQQQQKLLVLNLNSKFLGSIK